MSGDPQRLIDEHREQLEQAARLHVAITVARDLSGFARSRGLYIATDTSDGQDRGLDYARAMLMSGSVLGSVVAEASGSGEARFVVLAREYAEDSGRTLLAVRRWLAVFVAFSEGRLTGGVLAGDLDPGENIMHLDAAELVVGARDFDGNFEAGWG